MDGSGKPKEVSNKIAEKLKLPDKVLEDTLKSGAPRFHNQVCWARQYLVWEGYLDSKKRGTWSLTAKGRKKTLTEKESRDIFLKWVEIHQKARQGITQTEIIEEQQETAPEIFESRHNNLLDVLLSLSPKGFEEICAMLLRESDFEDVTVTGRSHDGGID